jgi:predicted AAA+ superfamily ATPase
MDLYRRGGDSLLGRYRYWRLHPFSLDDPPAGLTPQEAFQRLMTVGGLSEPFLDSNEREARRWRRERFDRVLREDIRDLASIRNIQLLSLFLDLLRHRVGGLITLSNLATDLQIILKDNRIEELVEVKWADETISKSLYYAERLRPPKAAQIVARLKRPYDQGKIQVRDPFTYFNPRIYKTAGV